ncbi:MAG TPA: hypothetical protein VEA80_13515 [Vitreimonas sp.]|uniref:hypothetical protein n=1 Tax=Vitreimonas sp. TaxID=3069702 RepID=UPI002D487A0D|nr:hypothetical protein [Vitreimonas sp.]HYD88488.1 hypothetical protein [Vitreimonas sp.]
MASISFLVLVTALVLLDPILRAAIHLEQAVLPGLETGQIAPAQLSLERIGRSLFYNLGFIAAVFILVAAYEAACLRWMIHGEVKGLFGLTLGADTWRVYGGYWAWAIFSGILSVAVIVAFPFVYSFAIERLGPSAPAARWGPLALLSVVITYACVSFAPANATSMAKRSSSFFSAWIVSRGRFWHLLVAYAVVWGIYVLIAGGLAVGALVWLFNVPLAEVISFERVTLVPTHIPRTWVDMLSEPSSRIGFWIYQTASIAVSLTCFVLLIGVNASVARAAIDAGDLQDWTNEPPR